jgi:hypothetical protein
MLLERTSSVRRRIMATKTKPPIGDLGRHDMEAPERLPTKRPPRAPIEPTGLRTMWRVIAAVAAVVVVVLAIAIWFAAQDPAPDVTPIEPDAVVEPLYDAPIARLLRERETARTARIETARDAHIERLTQERATAREARIETARDAHIDRLAQEREAARTARIEGVRDAHIERLLRERAGTG